MLSSSTMSTARDLACTTRSYRKGQPDERAGGAVDLERGVHLLGQHAHELKTQRGRRSTSKTGGKPTPSSLTTRRRVARRHAPQLHPYRPRPPFRKRVLERVRGELVQDEAARDRLVHAEGDIVDGELEPDPFRLDLGRPKHVAR